MDYETRDPKRNDLSNENPELCIKYIGLILTCIEHNLEIPKAKGQELAEIILSGLPQSVSTFVFSKELPFTAKRKPDGETWNYLSVIDWAIRNGG